LKFHPIISEASKLDVFEAIQARKSIRAYQDTPVPREKLERILDAGRLAPSARNTEPWHFITVTETEKRKRLAAGLYAKFVAQAPLAIVVLGDKKASSDWYVVDASLALENMVLAAVNEGLGTCVVGSFKEAEVKELLKIPSVSADSTYKKDVIKTADYILDLGPEGGYMGGEIIAQGTPEEVAIIDKSYTGQFLKRVLHRGF